MVGIIIRGCIMLRKSVYSSANCYIVLLLLPVGAVVGGIILIIFGLVSGAVFWWIRDQLRLTGQLLAVAGMQAGRAAMDKLLKECFRSTPSSTPS